MRVTWRYDGPKGQKMLFAGALLCYTEYGIKKVNASLCFARLPMGKRRYRCKALLDDLESEEPTNENEPSLRGDFPELPLQHRGQEGGGFPEEVPRPGDDQAEHRRCDAAFGGRGHQGAARCGGRDGQSRDLPRLRPRAGLCLSAGSHCQVLCRPWRAAGSQ